MRPLHHCFSASMLLHVRRRLSLFSSSNSSAHTRQYTSCSCMVLLETLPRHDCSASFTEAVCTKIADHQFRHQTSLLKQRQTSTTLSKMSSKRRSTDCGPIYLSGCKFFDRAIQVMQNVMEERQQQIGFYYSACGQWSQDSYYSSSYSHSFSS